MNCFFCKSIFCFIDMHRNYYNHLFHKVLSVVIGGYTGINFNLPPEVSSGVEKGNDRDCIDEMQDLELLDLERKFRDMGYLQEESETSER